VWWLWLRVSVHSFVRAYRFPDTEASAPRRVVMGFEGQGKLSKLVLQRLMLRYVVLYFAACVDLGCLTCLVDAGSGAGADMWLLIPWMTSVKCRTFIRRTTNNYDTVRGCD